MALPSAYLTSTKNLASILEALKKAQAPNRLTQRFLEDLGFTGNADRLIIAVLKALGFISETGEPLARYHEYLDTSQSGRILALGIMEAYSDIFQLNRKANTMSRAEVKGKMKTLSQGQYSESVLDKMASTFTALVERADFSSDNMSSALEDSATDAPIINKSPESELPTTNPKIKVDGLIYNINIHLPESRDQAVYDALFKSIREHLL